jgi:hypothetical protein
MITGQQTIEIGEVGCSIGFTDGFFEDEFGLILYDYRQRGFCTGKSSDIVVVVKEHAFPQPVHLNEKIFYHSLEYDSVCATMLFDTEKFEGKIGIMIRKPDRFTIVRIAELLETFICNAYIFYFFVKGIGTFIHSCGIAVGEKGYIFAGPSEHGKSTIAKLSLPRTVLCDEIVLLRKMESGKRHVFGTPFSGEIESTNKSADCEGIYFIEKGDVTEITSISRMAAVIDLMREGVIGRFMSIDAIMRICPIPKYLALLTEILEDIPCYRMKFLKNDSFWEVINGK